MGWRSAGSGAVLEAAADEVVAKAAAGERRTVHYSGRVQGVGFRYTTRSIASRHPVSGYVQNLSDGRVRVVAEGQPSELDRFLSEVASELGGVYRGGGGVGAAGRRGL